jgi:hypothetical protein
MSMEYFNPMIAATRTSYGTPEIFQVKEVPVPTPGDKEILVKVCATTVNRTDCAILMAKPFIMRFVTGFLNQNYPLPEQTLPELWRRWERALQSLK